MDILLPINNAIDDHVFVLKLPTLILFGMLVESQVHFEPSYIVLIGIFN